MKARLNQKRRTANCFNGVDPTGYTVRFELSKDGYWWAKADAFVALGVGRTIGKAKVSVARGIQLWLEETKKSGWPVSKPERESR